MKKILSIVLLVLMVSVPAYGVTPVATDSNRCQYCDAAGQCVHVSCDAVQGQQHQGQKQSQVQSQTTSQVVYANGTTAQFEVQRDLLVPPTIYPITNIPIQNGKVGDITASMPKFAASALVPLGKDEVIVKVLEVYYGSVFSRITLEDLESYLIDKAAQYEGVENVRYSVKYKDRVSSSGFGGGGSVSGTGNDGLTSATGSIIPGINWSTASPIYVVSFYLIK